MAYIFFFFRVQTRIVETDFLVPVPVPAVKGRVETQLGN